MMNKMMDLILHRFKVLMILCITCMAVFLLSLILDRFAPGCNQKLEFPDRVIDLLYLYPWQDELYSNLFNMSALVFPFFYLYFGMKEVAQAMFGIRFRTFEDAGAKRAVLLYNLGSYVAKSLVTCMILFLENAVLFLIMGNRIMVGIAWGFFARLFGVGLIYIMLALFAAACVQELETCSDVSLVMLLLPYVLARMHSLIRFFADQVEASNKKLAEPEVVDTWIRRLGSLQALAPVTWCVPGMHYPAWYGLCGLLLAVSLGVAGISILMDSRQ